MDEVYEPRYTFRVSQPTDVIFPANMPSDGFFIQFMVDDRYENLYYSSVENLWKFYNITPGPVHTNIAFLTSREQLASENSDWEYISNMLLQASIPIHVHTAIIPQIDECAISMANGLANASPKLLPILVEITKWSSVDITPYLVAEDYDIRDANVLDMEDYLLLAQVQSISMDENDQPRPASATRKITSGMLKKVKIEAADRTEACVICLEEFPNGLEVTQTPCKHVFHGECILQWLNYGSWCPLCRSEIPTDPPTN
ncbi:E3 ubiquitin-protein ligase RNF126-like [Coffea eugenioides]|uniref:E3 ubiquitin-protein ligase RNF126-like n=1 Tax=Coffea eugenioides TaxID=49369 RepID=UPI000F60839C|nr:E3 ubiquitin-protein ligase RNF126-like [Coffea eugenioides]